MSRIEHFFSLDGGVATSSKDRRVARTVLAIFDEEYNSAIELANEIWKDEKIINKKTKEGLETLYYQKDIEEEINDILNSVSLHRVDLSSF